MLRLPSRIKVSKDIPTDSGVNFGVCLVKKGDELERKEWKNLRVEGFQEGSFGERTLRNRVLCKGPFGQISLLILNRVISTSPLPMSVPLVVDSFGSTFTPTT